MKDQKNYTGKRAQVKSAFENFMIQWPYIVTAQTGLSDAFPVEVPTVYLTASGRAPDEVQRYITIPTKVFENEWEILD